MASILKHNLPKGIWTALVTPFLPNGEVDFAGFRKLVQRQIDAGILALVPCGTTGEAATLSNQEKIELVKICVEMSNGQVPVIAGAGHNDTRQAVAAHQEMANAGATAALHVTPYYNKPTQEGLYRHFRAIAESSELPIVLYNVPSRTAVDMLPATTLRLARDFPNIVAIKETSTETSRLQDMMAELKKARPEFLVLSGEDGFMLPFLTLGGDGLISVGSNFDPKLFCGVFESFNSLDLPKAQSQFSRVSQLTPLMFMTTNPLPVKTALSFLGLLKSEFRLPLCPMDSADAEKLKANLTAQGWL